MSALSEKMKAAGIDTVGARLTGECIEAIRHHPESVVDAWRYVGAVFGHEFVRLLMKDMKNAPGHQPKSPVNQGMANTVPYKPRVVPPERLERRREVQQLLRSKYKNSAGVPWSDVGWHELLALKRDGNEAEALLAANPGNVPNDGRTVGDVLGIDRVDQIIRAARS